MTPTIVNMDTITVAIADYCSYDYGLRGTMRVSKTVTIRVALASTITNTLTCRVRLGMVLVFVGTVTGLLTGLQIVVAIALVTGIVRIFVVVKSAWP